MNSYVAFFNRTQSKSGQNEIVLLALPQTNSTLQTLATKYDNGGYSFTGINYNYLCVGY